jgi:3-oxoacyl-[acyl-carrier protein] reductase
VKLLLLTNSRFTRLRASAPSASRKRQQFAPLHCLQLCQRCARAMRAAGWGRIVNMASLAGQQGGVTGGAHYAASKAGMIVLTKVLPRELAPDGVTVNAVAPAAIRTPVIEALGEQRIAELARGIPAAG